MHNGVSGEAFFLNFVIEALQEEQFSYVTWERVSDTHVQFSWPDDRDDPTEALSKRAMLLYYNEVGSPGDFRFDERG